MGKVRVTDRTRHFELGWPGRKQGVKFHTSGNTVDVSEYPEEGAHWQEVRWGELRLCRKEVEISGGRSG